MRSLANVFVAVLVLVNALCGGVLSPSWLRLHALPHMCSFVRICRMPRVLATRCSQPPGALSYVLLYVCGMFLRAGLRCGTCVASQLYTLLPLS